MRLGREASGLGSDLARDIASHTQHFGKMTDADDAGNFGHCRQRTRELRPIVGFREVNLMCRRTAVGRQFQFA